MLSFFSLFLSNHPATAHIYTLSLHDALPIFHLAMQALGDERSEIVLRLCRELGLGETDGVEAELQRFGADGITDRLDRKSTRLNSSHRCISYAVFCLKKKKQQHNTMTDSPTY